MGIKLALSFFLLCITLEATGQNRVITGKAIGSEFRDSKTKSPYKFWNLSNAKIFNKDFLLLGTTDSLGDFKLELPEGTDELEFTWIGMNPEKLKMTGNCEYIEVILLPDAIYDFATAKQERKRRKKDRAYLPELYKEAFAQGIFRQEVPCR